jgi:S1-C subfamily serine protease
MIKLASPRLALAGAALSLLACQQHGAAVTNQPDLSQAEKAPSLAECAASGGAIKKVGMAQAEVCIHLFPDRDKVCTDSKDCRGECRYVDDTRPLNPAKAGDEIQSLNDTPVGTKVEGKCQWSDDEFGCRATVEGGKLQAWSCVD